MNTKKIRQRLAELGDPDKAAHAQRFFKTGPGEYGEGDVFHGIRVPVIRALVKEVRELPLDEALVLLKSRYHEERLCALLLLVAMYGRSDAAGRKAIYTLYLQHTRWVNGWDLVDSSAHHIVGHYLEHRSRAPLAKLAKSGLIWERRIAVIATLHFIRQGDFVDILALAERLLQDPEDLIHKAVGWMLREVGNRDRPVEEDFLQAHYREMPRTMLRYAIEKFPEPRRKAYLAGKV